MNPSEILRLRKDLGLSQVDFAQLFDAHFMTISKWERGIASPSPYQAALMQQFRTKTDAERAKAQEEVKRLLVSAGVIAALTFLLSKG